ncbi:MAG: family 88 glycosyl hydrolase [Bacteroidales bacterium 45-6]|nr:MAG: family 88 glycosyl hydrolase [Bacteroidales bacterium 45-6]
MNRICVLFSIFTLLIVTSNKVCAFAPKASSLPASKDVLSSIKQANDYWQTHNSCKANAFWHHAAYHTGNMAAFEVTKDEKYKQYSLDWAHYNEWKGAKSDKKSDWKYTYGETDDYVLFGDWQICFQVYADLYQLDADPQKIARAREVLEYEMSTPNSDYLWWADGLYMVMPAMTKLYKITGNELYLDKLHEYFTFARNLMYNPESGLFFRDAKYIYPKHKTKNGRKDFWARGNGWVFAALAKVLQDLPANQKYRQDYLAVFKEMARAIKACQQPEGFWARSMVDLQHAPGYETSGTAFFTYGLLWGINNGYLDKREYLPVVEKSWNYLSEKALQPNGLVGYVQPIGERADQHKDVGPNTTADFGVGAFLLSATEMYKYLSK